MNVQFVSVLGGPGSGKGTQCSQLQDMIRCAHFSVGDLLRAEAAKPDSPYREIIEENMRLGRVGPKEITVGTLAKNIKQALENGTQTFFLDGFPRRLDQAEHFEEHVGSISLVLVLDCPQETLVQRLLQRRRGDDDIETINRRIATYQITTAAVLEKYDSMAKVVTIQADFSKETVFGKIISALTNANINLQSRPLPGAHLEVLGEISIDPSEDQTVREIDAGISLAQI